MVMAVLKEAVDLRCGSDKRVCCRRMGFNVYTDHLIYLWPDIRCLGRICCTTVASSGGSDSWDLGFVC